MISGLSYWIFGRLEWSDLLIKSNAIATGASCMVVIVAIAIVALLTWTGRWGWLWREWLTSLDHKRIGIMYIVISFIMMARAIAEAMVMRTQQAMAAGGGTDLVGAEHFGQLFTTHGTVMIFFVAMPFLSGLINYLLPLQIGARDLSFPFMNAVGLALTWAGAVLIMVSLTVGDFSTGGWSAYPPFTELAFSPGEGVDYWIWSVTLTGIGTTLTGINFAVTIYKERCPGMHLMRMPLFCWTALCTAILIVFALPPLTVASSLLALDRYLDFHFFTNGSGGNMMNYANLFWLFGHPEVYILILPAFGVWSEVISTFSGKRLYGYRSLVLATMCIAVLSFTVWMHHFFTMGQSANVNAAFGFATMLIGIPTGVKVYDWILTMYRGRIRFSAPMLFAITFLFSFVVGGLSGILLSNAPTDFAMHNSLFLVAHFHNMLIPGTLFGFIAGYMYWFPKAFGFRLDERWGRIAWGLWTAGFFAAFAPLYSLGLMGAMRRTSQTYDPAYEPFLYVALVGAALLFAGFVALVVQLVVSTRHRDRLAVPIGDPWDGRALEWFTPSPPPEWNFARLPQVECIDAFAREKREGDPYAPQDGDYADIEMPRNTGLPTLIGMAGIACAFGLVWHIWWMAIVGFVAMWGFLVARSFESRTTRTIPAATVREANEAWLSRARMARAVPREIEFTAANTGRAEPLA
ncbi:cytochrome ubiquinol oxidase subunit I [Erythrobacter sp. 3-20A1M]|uniref:cbb3-type cytochrome c oxidase subunit I n=1 Tax=Erythrobacter sp. 3-20A1M TaxID=2653850 RepID=UPI001BFCA782|nr:cbb3-type cytochrome c oxidase subunit I [Erythrobacter sp. 3-20A1M]QWC56725.1 cytochrome ubiquinol oxidase subunit I [Erythrobacter sp. 3-20A1M]